MLHFFGCVCCATLLPDRPTDSVCLFLHSSMVCYFGELKASPGFVFFFLFLFFSHLSTKILSIEEQRSGEQRETDRESRGKKKQNKLIEIDLADIRQQMAQRGIFDISIGISNENGHIISILGQKFSENLTTCTTRSGSING